MLDGTTTTCSAISLIQVCVVTCIQPVLVYSLCLITKSKDISD